MSLPIHMDFPCNMYALQEGENDSHIVGRQSISIPGRPPEHRSITNICCHNWTASKEILRYITKYYDLQAYFF